MGIFKLGWRDLVKGLVVVTLGACFYAGIALLPSLNISPELQAIISTILGYLAKNLVSTEDGKFVGKI